MKKLTTDEFIERAEEMHGKQYDYSLVNYVGAHNHITVICPKHGLFEQMANAHLQGRGCSKCVIENMTKSKENFVLSANKLHDNKYLYEKVVYMNTNTKVIITCPIHGDFSMLPANHLKGQNCPKCGTINATKAQTKSISKFIEDAHITHGNKYDYSKVVYTRAKNKITIICPVHGEFEQTPDSHLYGRGCPKCAKYGFDPSKPAYLYYLKITTDDNQILYKIGITNRTVNERFQIADLQKIEIIKQKLYEVGQDALDWENKLKQQFNNYRYVGPNILKDGNTELFTEDIISLL